MGFNIHNRGLLSLVHHSERDINHLIELARDLKRLKYSGVRPRNLEGKNIALIFEKTSTRTRCAFEVAAYDEGAHVTYIDPTSSQIGHKESMKDTARVLGRMYDAIEYRGFGQDVVDELAEYAGVPVFNGLTDEFHPTQMLADVLTMTEHCVEAVARDLLCLRRRRPQQHGQLAAAGGRQARHGCADRRTQAPAAGPGPRQDV